MNRGIMYIWVAGSIVQVSDCGKVIPRVYGEGKVCSVVPRLPDLQMIKAERSLGTRLEGTFDVL